MSDLRAIPGYQGYFVSDDGRVFSLRARCGMARIPRSAPHEMAGPVTYDSDRDSLSSVLERLGWAHEAGPYYKRRITTDTGEVLDLDAQACWQLLRERGLLREVPHG